MIRDFTLALDLQRWRTSMCSGRMVHTKSSKRFQQISWSRCVKEVASFYRRAGAKRKQSDDVFVCSGDGRVPFFFLTQIRHLVQNGLEIFLTANGHGAINFGQPRKRFLAPGASKSTVHCGGEHGLPE